MKGAPKDATDSFLALDSGPLARRWSQQLLAEAPLCSRLAINARIKHSSLRVAEASERLPTPPSTRSRTVPTYLAHWGTS